MQKHKSTIKRILAYIGHYKWGVLASLVLAAITVASTLYLPVLIGYAVDCIVSAGHVDFTKLTGILGKMAVMIAITAISQWLMNHINKCVFRRADRVVALSSEQKNCILRTRNAVDELVTVIPNWYRDEGGLRDREENRFRELTAGRFVVSYFGNMGTMQDMDTILGAIRALREEKDVFFLFAGHGNKMEKLREIIAQESIENVRIHSFLHGQDFQDALAVSDCALISLEKGATGLCVPSKTYSYMMQGIPLLAIMDECDIVRDIQSGAGLWVRNGESERLAKAIRFLREKARDMRRKCRELYLQKYTTEICTGKYVSLFWELLHPETGKENRI